MLLDTHWRMQEGAHGVPPPHGRKLHFMQFLGKLYIDAPYYKILYPPLILLSFLSQGDKKHFNRGSLFNVGFAEIRKKQEEYDCIGLHDVDNYPEDTRNLYMCDGRAIHLVSKQRYVRNDYREYVTYS